MKKILISSAIIFATSAQAATMPSGGIGLSKAQWEKGHKVTGTDIMGPIYDGKYIVTFTAGKVDRIEMMFDSAIPVTQAKTMAKALLPKDAKLVKQYSPAGISEKQVFWYKSKFAKGDVHFQFNTYPDSPTTTKRLIVALGNNP